MAAKNSTDGASRRCLGRQSKVLRSAFSAGSIEGISAARAHDSDATAPHETGTEVAVGWHAALDSWKALPFESFAELSCVMTNPASKVQGTVARVAGLERVRRKMKVGGAFAFTALGNDIYEKRGEKWIIVHSPREQSRRKTRHLNSFCVPLWRDLDGYLRRSLPEGSNERATPFRRYCRLEHLT